MIQIFKRTVPIPTEDFRHAMTFRQIWQLIESRNELRDCGDFDRADIIRDRLLRAGIKLIDLA